MIIRNIKSEKHGNRHRVSATVCWEDIDRPSQEFYFETDEEFSKDLSFNPHAFLPACALAGMHHGEIRVSIDEEICPELKDGLITACKWIHHWYEWYRPEHPLIRIEAKTSRSGISSQRPERAGFFFSGGIDSLACLRANRINYPMEHPSSIKDGILVYGLEVDEPEAFRHVISSQSDLALDAGITLIPVYTNIRYLDDDWTFWENEFEGAVFSSIAHAFDNRFSVVSIASTHDIPYSHPHGSHPLLDPNYSSHSLRIRHECITLSRLERTKILLDWDYALQHLRVCNRSTQYQSDMLNCGNCEKCIRTMLALLALGALDRTKAFPTNDVSEELIRRNINLNDTSFPFYPELMDPLIEIGRKDLARAIKQKLTIYHDGEPGGFKEWAKRFDHDYFHGSLVRIKKKIPNLSVRS